MKYCADQIISRVSIRGKVSFVLAIVEHLLDDLKADNEGYKMVIQALDKAWEWQENLNLSGDELFSLLMDENDDGLILHEGMADKSVKSSWIALTSAIIYVSWLAYKVKDEKIMPSAVHEVDDNAVSTVLENAEKSKIFNQDYVFWLCSYIMETCSSKIPDEIGNRVDRKILAR